MHCGGGVLSLYLDVHIEGGSPQIVQIWTRGGRGSKIPKFLRTYLMEAPLTNERTKARSFTTRVAMQGPRAPVSPLGGGDGILLRRRVDSEADRAALMALLDDKRIAHSFGTCVPIFQGLIYDI